MRTKAKPIVKPAIPRAIAPARNAPSNTFDPIIETLSAASTEAMNLRQVSKQDTSYSMECGLSKMEMRRKLRDRLQLHRGMVMMKRHAVPLPPNSDGTPLTSKTIPFALSDSQKAAIRQKTRQALRLKMIKRGELPDNPSREEVELWIQGAGEGAAERLVQLMNKNVVDNDASAYQDYGIYNNYQQDFYYSPQQEDFYASMSAFAAQDPFFTTAPDTTQLYADAFLSNYTSYHMQDPSMYANHDGTSMDMGVSELTDAELMKMGQDVEYLLSLNLEEFSQLNVVK